MDSALKAQLLKIQAAKELEELLENKPIEWKEGFEYACGWLGDCYRELVRIYGLATKNLSQDVE